MVVMAQHVNERQRVLRGLGMIFRPSERVRYLRGLADEQPLLETWSPPLTVETPIDPASISLKVGQGQPLTSNEQAVWNAISPTAQNIFTQADIAMVQAQGVTPPFSLTQWMKSQTISGVPNSYLVLGVAGIFFVSALKKKKR